MRLTFTYYYVLYAEMLTKCTAKYALWQVRRQALPPLNQATYNSFKSFSDERFRPKALLMYYKSIIIQHEVVLPIKMSIDREELVAL